MMPQVEPNHYISREYVNKERFCGYWHQIDEVTSLHPSRVLEIGIGNGTVSRFLRDLGLDVVTIDVDRRLKPDVVSTVLRLPFANGTFDVAACYEVLEHLPYESFGRALEEMHRMARHVVLSLPDADKTLRLRWGDSRWGHISIWARVPIVKREAHSFDGEHYWEINKVGYPLSKILAEIRAKGFTVLKTYRLPENPYHRFFVLRKQRGFLLDSCTPKRIISKTASRMDGQVE